MKIEHASIYQGGKRLCYAPEGEVDTIFGMVKLSSFKLDPGVKVEQLAGKGIIRFKVAGNAMEAAMDNKGDHIQLLKLKHFKGEILEQ